MMDVIRNEVNSNIIGKEAWVLVVNSDLKYEPMKVTIQKVIRNSLTNDFGIVYERLGRKIKTRVPEHRCYIDEYTAQQMAKHMNGEY